MNVPQLLHRIGRRARGGDFTKLALTEQGDLFEAANAALQKIYNALPVYFKQQTQGFLLPAPRQLTVDVTQYSKDLGADVFTDEEIGRTVIISGDGAWNQVIGPAELLNPYMGATGTGIAATVYGDALFSDTTPFDRVIGNISFANQQMAPIISSTMARGNADPGIWLQQTFGRPMVWWTQPIGNSQGRSPVLVLRVAPAPDTAYAVNIRLGFWPKRIGFEDYQAGTEIVVPDQFLETALIPLALAELMSKPIWETISPTSDERIESGALEAISFLRQQPAQQAPSNRVFTPQGY